MLAAFRLPLEGARLLLRERRLWLLALVPFLLSLLAFGAAITGVVTFSGELYGWATLWVPELSVSAWYQWLWIGPLRAICLALSGVLFLAIAAACLVAAFLLASLLASPFLDALSFRTEEIVTGSVRDETGAGLSGTVLEGLRAAREDLRRMLFFLAVVVPLALAGLVIPGAQLLTGPAIMVFTIFFLPLDYASYTLDRRRVSFAEKRRWLFADKGTAIGFGAAAFLLCLVPGLNFFAMPVLVIAGTLLALRVPGAAGETATSP